MGSGQLLLAGSIAGSGCQAQADGSASTAAPLDAGHPHSCYSDMCFDMMGYLKRVPTCLMTGALSCVLTCYCDMCSQ